MACQKVCIAGLSINSQRLAEALLSWLPSPHTSLLTELKAQGIQGKFREGVCQHSGLGIGRQEGAWAERVGTSGLNHVLGESQTLHSGLALARGASIIWESVRRRRFLGNRLNSSGAPGAVCRPLFSPSSPTNDPPKLDFHGAPRSLMHAGGAVRSRKRGNQKEEAEGKTKVGPNVWQS